MKGTQRDSGAQGRHDYTLSSNQRLVDVIKYGITVTSQVSEFERSFIRGTRVFAAIDNSKIFDSWLASLTYSDGVVMSMWKPITGETVELHMTRVRHVEAMDSEDVLLVNLSNTRNIKFEARDRNYRQQLQNLFDIFLNPSSICSSCSINCNREDRCESDSGFIVIPKHFKTTPSHFTFSSRSSLPIQSKSVSLAPLTLRVSEMNPVIDSKDESSLRRRFFSPSSLLETLKKKLHMSCYNCHSRNSSLSPLREEVWKSMLENPSQINRPPSPTAEYDNDTCCQTYFTLSDCQEPSCCDTASTTVATDKLQTLISRSTMVHKMDMKSGGVVRRTRSNSIASDTTNPDMIREMEVSSDSTNPDKIRVVALDTLTRVEDND